MILSVCYLLKEDSSLQKIFSIRFWTVFLEVLDFVLGQILKSLA